MLTTTIRAYTETSYTNVQIKRYRCTLSKPYLSVVHPNLPRSTPFLPKTLSAARHGAQSFFPLGYKHAAFIERVRSGGDLGEDYPYNLTSSAEKIRNRTYNLQKSNVPWMFSSQKGVSFIHRRQQWVVTWVQNGRHQTRAFKGYYGISKTKDAAEKFRQELEESGRVDNRRTDRQARISFEQKRQEDNARAKNTFMRTKADLMAEWDRYWHTAKYHWEDDHIKFQMRKFGKILDPRYQMPDFGGVDIMKFKPNMK